jgi:hypothetical protein
MLCMPFDACVAPLRSAQVNIENIVLLIDGKKVKAQEVLG